MKHFYSTFSRALCIIVLALAGFSSNTFAQSVTIGTTTGTFNDYFYGPLYRSSATSTFNYSMYGYVYTAAELGIPAGATITQIEWLKYNTGTLTGGNNTFNILLKNSAAATLTSGAQWSVLTAGATTAYASTTQNILGGANTWVAFPLTTPYVYTGSSLEIYTDHVKAGTASGSITWYDNAATGKAIGNASGTVLTGTSTLTTTYGNNRPTIRITYTTGPCTDPPTPGTAVSTSTMVCPSVPFTVSLSGNTTGTGQTYQWQSSPDNLTWTNIVGATSGSYTTTQTASTYYRASMTCGLSTATSASVYVQQQSFLNCYCTSAATSTADDDIGNVTFGTLNNGNPLPSLSNPASNNLYTNFTALPTVTYFKGNTYNISIQQINSGSFYNTWTNVFIDYNQNGMFDLPAERVFNGPISAAGQVLSGSVTIPFTALTGVTRMRVVMVEGGSSAQSPCGTYTWGETEDYNIDLQPLPPCIDPPTAGTSITSASPVCQTTSFTLSLSGHTYGSGQTYQWQSSPNGTTWTNIPGATNEFYTTTQSATTYYQALLTCGTSTVASTPVMVQQQSFLNCYCTSNATSTADDDIGNVTFGSMSNGNPLPSLNNPNANNTYSNFTALPPVAYFKGNTYPISIQQINTGSFYNTWTNVFIDYNHNGAFDLPAERVFNGPISAAGQVLSGNITIPTTALTGITLMRIVMVEGGSSAQSPCGTYTWGETEDYYVDLQPIPPIDAGVSILVSPTTNTCYTSSETISIQLKNYGSDTLDLTTHPVTINASATGPNPTTFGPVTVSTGQMLIGATQTVVITTTYNMSAPGTYIFSASATVANDGWAPNNAMPNDTIIVNNPSVVASAAAVVCEFDSASISVTATPIGFGTVDTLYNTATMAIPDDNPLGVASTIMIPNGPPTASSVISVHIDSISHTFAGQLGIYLVAPNGSFIDLSSGNGGAGDNYINTTFINSAATSITTGGAPFSSSYKPEQNFSLLNGTGAGTWTLRVIDGVVGDIGTLYGWSITMPLGNSIVTYSWSPGAGLSSTSAVSPMASPAATTTYYITATDYNGCSNTDSVQVTVNPAPAVTLGADFGMCQGSTATLDPGAGFISYMWQDSTSNQTLVVDSTGTYVVEVMDGNTCRNWDSVNVTVFNPQVNLGADTAICQNGSLTLDAGPGFTSYGWSTTASTQQITVSAANTYIVGVLDANGCPAADTIMVGINALPALNLGNDGAVCNNAMLDAGPGYSYIWQDSSSNQIYNATTTGSYYVDIMDNNGCMNTDTINLVVNPSPAVNLGQDVVQCGGPVVLDANNTGNTFVWSNNAVTQTTNVNASGTYFVDVTNSFGCVGSDTIMVTINSLPNAVAGNDTLICAESTVTLTGAPGFASYMWQEVSFQAATQAITVSPGITTTYSLTVTDANGCTSVPDMVTITVEPLPNANFAVSQTGTTATFTNTSVGNQNVTYLWNFGDATPNSTQMNPTHTYATNGFYTVTLIVITDCGADTTTRFVSVTVGVDEVEGIGTLLVYPNPSEGNFNIAIKDAAYSELTIEVLDIQGKIVYTERDMNVTAEYLKTIDLSGIAKGMYYLRLNSGKQVTTQKLIIQ